jgi:hypothetical protein
MDLYFKKIIIFFLLLIGAAAYPAGINVKFCISSIDLKDLPLALEFKGAGTDNVEHKIFQNPITFNVPSTLRNNKAFTATSYCTNKMSYVLTGSNDFNDVDSWAQFQVIGKRHFSSDGQPLVLSDNFRITTQRQKTPMNDIRPYLVLVNKNQSWQQRTDIKIVCSDQPAWVCDDKGRPFVVADATYTISLPASVFLT